jgi:hypothetical protein
MIPFVMVEEEVRLIRTQVPIHRVDVEGDKLTAIPVQEAGVLDAVCQKRDKMLPCRHYFTSQDLYSNPLYLCVLPIRGPCLQRWKRFYNQLSRMLVSLFSSTSPA